MSKLQSAFIYHKPEALHLLFYSFVLASGTL